MTSSWTRSAPAPDGIGRPAGGASWECGRRPPKAKNRSRPLPERERSDAAGRNVPAAASSYVPASAPDRKRRDGLIVSAAALRARRANAPHEYGCSHRKHTVQAPQRVRANWIRGTDDTVLRRREPRFRALRTEEFQRFANDCREAFGPKAGLPFVFGSPPCPPRRRKGSAAVPSKRCSKPERVRP